MSVPTSSYALLHVTGAEAAAFLHAQLTIDVHGLDDNQHALSAWCDAKGRVLCTLRLTPADGGYLMLIPATLAGAITRRLRMYVLRARVNIADASENWAAFGLSSKDATLPRDGALVRDGDSLRLGVNTGDGPGALLIVPQTATTTALPLTLNAWQLAEIDAGLPEIRPATSALFAPQMLNLHWLHAVAFNKGCYPGQEIVARLQYRGRLQRRLFRMAWEGQQPQAGDVLVDGNGKKRGTVIRAAHCDDEAGRLLAVVAVDALEHSLSTASARLTMLDLPYATSNA